MDTQAIYQWLSKFLSDHKYDGTEDADQSHDISRFNMSFEDDGLNELDIKISRMPRFQHKYDEDYEGPLPLKLLASDYEDDLVNELLKSFLDFVNPADKPMDEYKLKLNCECFKVYRAPDNNNLIFQLSDDHILIKMIHSNQG